MDRYEARINAHGNTQRERYINRIKQDVNNKAYQNPSYKVVKINGMEANLIIDNGTSNTNKNFSSLPNSTVKLGDYIEWDNKIYLVNNLNPDDEIYSSGTMTLCTYEIAWQKPDGTIATRWAVCSDASKYDEGIVANGSLQFPTGSIAVTVPIDYDTKRLKRDMRFVIDTTTDEEYADGVIPEVYVLSSRKTAFNNDSYFNRGGTLSLLMTANTFDSTKDKYVKISNQEKSVWVCDYNDSSTVIPTPPPLPHQTISATIEGSNETYFGDIGYWKVEFKDESGVALSEDKIPTDWILQVVDKDNTVINSCIIKKDGLEISLQVNDDSLLGEFLYLQVVLDDFVLTTKKIEILGGM